MLSLGQCMMGRDKRIPQQVIATNPPYNSVVEAMQHGWRVVQFPQQFPAYPGMEYHTSYLRFEYILEKMEEIDD